MKTFMGPHFMFHGSRSGPRNSSLLSCNLILAIHSHKMSCYFFDLGLIKFEYVWLGYGMNKWMISFRNNREFLRTYYYKLSKLF
jgi:hypothetical protein